MTLSGHVTEALLPPLPPATLLAPLPLEAEDAPLPLEDAVAELAPPTPVTTSPVVVGFSSTAPPQAAATRAAAAYERKREGFIMAMVPQTWLATYPAIAARSGHL